jgi:hypothetical protein
MQNIMTSRGFLAPSTPARLAFLLQTIAERFDAHAP